MSEQNQNDIMSNDAVVFHEAIASGWGSAYQKGSFQRRLNVYKPILDRLVRNGEAWLDLGCGAGVLTQELLSRGARVTALDGAPSMLDAANRQVGNQAGEVEWLQGDVRNLSFAADVVFDGVICSSVIEYLPEADSILSEVSRVLKPSGCLIVSLPPKWSLTRTLQKLHRVLASLFGIEKHAYLSISKLEFAPKQLFELFDRHSMFLNGVDRFDPVPAIMQCSCLRPALLIIQARRKSREKIMNSSR